VLREGVGLADRATFVTDPDGVIQLVEITPEGVGRNAAELLRKIKAAKYWREQSRPGLPGQVGRRRETLAPSIDLVGKI
jgi:alkyl hydroperoxide reductase subunit AhpC